MEKASAASLGEATRSGRRLPDRVVFFAYLFMLSADGTWFLKRFFLFRETTQIIGGWAVFLPDIPDGAKESFMDERLYIETQQAENQFQQPAGAGNEDQRTPTYLRP